MAAESLRGTDGRGMTSMDWERLGWTRIYLPANRPGPVDVSFDKLNQDLVVKSQLYGSDGRGMTEGLPEGLPEGGFRFVVKETPNGVEISPSEMVPYDVVGFYKIVPADHTHDHPDLDPEHDEEGLEASDERHIFRPQEGDRMPGDDQPAEEKSAKKPASHKKD